MVVDTSALIAILQDEPERDAFIQALARRRAFISAVNVMEAETVVRGRIDPSLVFRIRDLLAINGVEIVPFDDDQAVHASKAAERFGKGRHPARLNMGDCAAYALARSMDLPLLYKGDDFSQTDVRSALTTG